MEMAVEFGTHLEFEIQLNLSLPTEYLSALKSQHVMPSHS